MFFILAEDNKSLAPILRAASVPLLDLETCRLSDVNGGRSQSILDTMICAGLFYSNKKPKKKIHYLFNSNKK